MHRSHPERMFYREHTFISEQDSTPLSDCPTPVLPATKTGGPDRRNQSLYLLVQRTNVFPSSETWKIIFISGIFIHKHPQNEDSVCSGTDSLKSQGVKFFLLPTPVILVRSSDFEFPEPYEQAILLPGHFPQASLA